VLLATQEGRGVHVLVLDQELLDLLITLLVLSGLCTKEKGIKRNKKSW
jgi:hypothetical protein